jgi:hypothetical protein
VYVSIKSINRLFKKYYSAVIVLVVYSPASFYLNSTSSASQNGTLNMPQFLSGAFFADL